MKSWTLSGCTRRQNGCGKVEDSSQFFFLGQFAIFLALWSSYLKKQTAAKLMAKVTCWNSCVKKKQPNLKMSKAFKKRQKVKSLN